MFIKIIDKCHPAVIALLKARLADIIWTRQAKGNFRFVELAVTSYLDSARNFEHSGLRQGYCVDRAERAVQLAFSLSGKSPLQQLVLGYIEGFLVRGGENDSTFESARMMKLLLDQESGDPGQFGPLSEKLAQRAEAEGEYLRVREYWELCARWLQLARDTENARNASIAAAETHVKEARKALNQTAAPHLHAAGHLEFAIGAFRRIGGMAERVNELHQLLLEYQQKSTSEFGHFSSAPIDMTDFYEQARKRVTEKPLYDAIFTLATLCTPSKLSYLRDRAQEKIDNNPLISLFPSTRVNSMGKSQKRDGTRLMSSKEFYSYVTIYSWWLTLRLCCVPVIHRLAQATDRAQAAEKPLDEIA
jgi:hypothetical protein